MAQKRASSKKSATRKSKAARTSGKTATRSSTKAATRKSKSSPKQKAAKGATKSATGKSKLKQNIFGETTITSISNFTESNVRLTNTQYGNVVNAPPNDTTPSRIDIPW